MVDRRQKFINILRSRKEIFGAWNQSCIDGIIFIDAIIVSSLVRNEKFNVRIFKNVKESLTKVCWAKGFNF